MSNHDGGQPAFEVLLEKASLQGYITHEEILEVCPTPEQHREALEAFFARLYLEGIPVYEDLPFGESGGSSPSEHGWHNPTDSDLEAIERDAELSGEALPTTDTVSLYFREMSQFPLLTVEEERQLARSLEEGKLATQRLAKQNGRLSEEEREALRRKVEAGRQARDTLIRSNTRLVISIAKRYIGKGVPFPDLIQEGNLGLMRAVSKFDYRRGFKFSTYATWWIRQAITRALADQGRVIRLPVHMGDRLRKLFQVAREMEQDLGRPPTPEELAEKMELPLSRVEWMLRISADTLSLHKPVGEDEDSELGYFIEDTQSPAPMDAANRELLREKLEQLLDTLTPRQARILRMRFGLIDGRTYTLEEVGQKFGVTRERIRQIEAQALGRLRHPQRSRQLKGFL